VILTARSQARVSELTNALNGEGVRAHALAMDVTKVESIAAASSQVADRFGKSDGLINIAAAKAIYGETVS